MLSLNYPVFSQIYPSIQNWDFGLRLCLNFSTFHKEIKDLATLDFPIFLNLLKRWKIGIFEYLPTSCLGVFDYFMGLALKGLKLAPHECMYVI